AIQARIPHALMKLYSLAPVHYSAPVNKLLVGFVHSVEHQVLHMIEQITGCVAAPCFITASDYWTSMRNLADQTVDVAFDRITSGAEMANIIQSYAFQTEAEEAR